MNLQQLERAAELIKLGSFLDKPLEEIFAAVPDGTKLCALVRPLLRDKQFTTLLHLKRAENSALLALDELTSDTEYLRDELEQHLHRLQDLLVKIEQEEHLRRDREALLSLGPAEEQGVGEWTSGSSTG